VVSKKKLISKKLNKNLTSFCFENMPEGVNEAVQVVISKRAKLAALSGYETKDKNAVKVPKDTNFSLWLNVARSNR
jgi:hypothetical protein